MHQHRSASTNLSHHSSSYSPQDILEGYRTIEAADADDHAANLTGWNQLYDQLAPGRFHGAIRELWIGKVQLFSEFTSHKVRQSCQAWPGSWWFGIPLQDGADTKLGCACIDKDSIAVHRGGTEFELLTPSNFEILGIVVEQAELSEYAEIIGQIPLFRTSDTGSLLQIGRERRLAAQKLFREILHQVAESPVILNHSASRQSIRCSIIEALIDMCSTSASTARPSSTHISRHQLVSRIREYVASRKDRPVLVPEICRRFYVTRRTLQNAFQDVLGVSPATYFRMVRLNGARRMLHDHNRVTLIQDAAAEWGFWHLSQFAHDYRKMFGELPSSSLHQQSSCDCATTVLPHMDRSRSPGAIPSLTGYRAPAFTEGSKPIPSAISLPT